MLPEEKKAQFSDVDGTGNESAAEPRGSADLSPSPANSFQTGDTPASMQNGVATDVGIEADEPPEACCDMGWLVAPFKPIGLKQLNAKAEMLNRLDNKYVVNAGVLRDALSDLAARFDILEIDGKRQFTYETCYFDDPDSSSYFDHHRDRRRRFKVRVRKYTDAQLCFVEVKLKTKRGITIKKRLQYEVDRYGMLDERAWEHIASCYQELYSREFRYALEPVLEMRYQRVTLVAKEGGERMTIDCSLAFFGNGRTRTISDDLFIVETKSSNGNGIADKVLRALHQHPTKRCSKYCVARAALQGVGRYNKFLSALRKLNALPEQVRAPATAPPVVEEASLSSSATSALSDQSPSIAAGPYAIVAGRHGAPS
jgi:hypothetical protein